MTEAKEVIIKMTEDAEQAAEAEPAKPVEQPPAKAKSALAVKRPSGGDIYTGRRLPAHKNIPDYAIDHGERKNHMLTNDEIGWVD